MTVSTLLVANRGEIACRIMRTAKALGIRTVAVHSDVDALARHVREADVAVSLGGAKPQDSYLRAELIFAAARASGADAIHPGYGFLSENAAFAQACVEQDLVFLGPPASAIEAMGSKSAAKALMADAGVPLVPGYHGAAQDLDTLRQACAQIGYPVLLKPVAGGGGKGMHVVEDEASLAESLACARREAISSFGDGRLLVEQYLRQPRHVEIQVFADQHGQCLYLNERDCSIQRRHQKVLEEAPAPGMAPSLRQAMGEAAVRAALAIGYVGAGTVEFLLDDQGRFFFMEMNTRLQVEHPVTEAITGLDLVAWQIRVARGEPLPLRQGQVPLDGHAIEVRLYAEDPDQDFLPASGRLDLYREPAAAAGRRVDSGVSEGDTVSPFYDPMLAKLIAWGETREDARLRLLAMLGETRVGGIRTNLAFLSRILQHPAFVAEQLDTGFIGRHRAELLPAPAALDEIFWQQAAAAYLASEPLQRRADDPGSPWSSADGWRLNSAHVRGISLSCEGQRRRVMVTAPSHLAADAVRQGDSLFFPWQGELRAVCRVGLQGPAAPSAAANGSLAAPLNGSIVRLLVQPGQVVAAGDTLVVLEAMKMEHSIRAAFAATVTALYCTEGELVEEGLQLLALQAFPQS